MNQDQKVQLVKFLYTYGYRTGSSVLGGSDFASDIDILISRQELEFICFTLSIDIAKLRIRNYITTEVFSYKLVLTESEVLDVLITKDSIIKDLWVATTKKYLELIDTSIPISKCLRVSLFETIKHELEPPF